MIKTFGTYMKEHGWQIEWQETRDEPLPAAITDRYRSIPKEWLDFLDRVRDLASPDDTVWFLCAKDFAAHNDVAFPWNEWERLSLESAEGDPDWQAEIRRFWNGHLPVVMSVKDGYSYYAIDMEDGSIVHGAEPEFEECETVAVSFSDFMEKIIKGELAL